MVKMKKSMAFFISFMLTVAFVSILPLILKPLLKNISNTTAQNIVLPTILSLGLIFFMFFQGFLRWKWNKKILDKSQSLVLVKGDNFTYTEKSWIYLFLVLIYFTQVIASLSFESITIERIVLFVIFLCISIFLMRISEKAMKIVFTKEGILITGLDLRIDIPLGQPLHNATGYYPYSIIDGYLPLQESIQLFVEFEQGKIIVNAKGEQRNKIIALLKANKIEMRKYT